MVRGISPYGILGGTGFLCGMIYLCIRCRDKLKRENAVYIYVFSGIFAMIGAKILYLVTNIPEIITAFKGSDNTFGVILSVVTGGFVYYGGLVGAIIGVYLMCKYFKCDSTEYVPILTPCIPLIHGFGRIGCHVVGCCHGVATSSKFFSVTYANSKYAPCGVGLVPVQITEAVIEFILFFVTLILSTKEKYKGFVLPFYLITYAIARFILEFFRGDSVRGMFLMFSTSQWISLIILVVTILVCKPRVK